jgi:5'-phosphate synthase pdxT subunit
MTAIGVLAVQGAFAKHAEVLGALGHRVVLVRSPSDLSSLDGLVLPGGESSVQLEMLARLGLEEPIRRFEGPILATCAGLILLARVVENPAQRSLGLVDVTVARNAWGRQLDSFEATSDDGGRHLVFIRAPRILRVGPSVRVLATLAGEPVLVRAGAITCATYHPELTDDASLHAEVFGRSESCAA